MLNIYEAFVLERLASMMGKKNRCWPKQDYLSRHCRMSDRQLRRALKSLEDKKIITIKRTRDKNIYSFNEFWLAELDKFSSTVEAAESVLDRTNSPPDRTGVPIPLSNTNINNKQPILKDFTGGQYEPSPSGEQPSWLKEKMLKH